MKKQLLIIIFFLVLFSCKDKERPLEDNNSIQEQYTGDLKIKERISIPIDQKVFYRSRQTHVVERNDTTYLYRENHLNNSIDIFNWTAKKKSETITFDGFSIEVNPFLPLTGDSIFFATVRSGDLLITKNGSVTSMAQPLVENDKRIRYYTSENGFRPVKIGSEIFMYTVSNVQIQDPEFATRLFLASYDLNAGKAKLRKISYPDVFKEHCWSEQHSTAAFTRNHKEQLVISFPTDPTLYIYDPAKDSLVGEFGSAQSRFVKEIPSYHECDYSDFTTYFKYLKSVARYRSITYDKFKNIYYRIVSLPAEHPIDGQRDHDIVMPLTVMVLDEEFNVITERKLPAYTYDPKDFFITNEGLWISTANEGAEDFNEDALSYTLFSLKGI